jgi:hypothetical protein
MSGHVGVANLLLDHKANPNYLPAKGQGRTAFEAAAEWSRMDAMSLLIQHSVQLDMKVNNPPKSQYERAVRFAEENRRPASKRYVQSLYKHFSQNTAPQEAALP